MYNQIILKEKRVNLLNDIIKQIKISIEKNKIKGELSSKIYIYSRLADYTYYSEVSIRKFLTGIVPKDVFSFIQGIAQYCNLVKVDEQIIQNFINEYIQATNGIIIDNISKFKTKTNIIPQDLTSIIKPKKIINFLDSFENDNVNIAYIYGYKLSGKTKSVMSYIIDLVNKNIYDNVIWIDIDSNINQINTIIDTIHSFAFQNMKQASPDIKLENCLNFISETKSIIVFDFSKFEIEDKTMEILKNIARNTKTIIISSQKFDKYEEKLQFYAKSFCTNNYIQKDEFEQMLKLNEQKSSIIENYPQIIDELYQITGGFPFASVYILKKIIEDNKIGISYQESVKKYKDYNIKEYEELASKIILEIWVGLNDLAKKILITCAKFNHSVSIKLVSKICGIEITTSEWKEALKQCYEHDLLNTIFLNNPRISMNNMVKTLVLQYENKENFDNSVFLEKLPSFYIELTTNIDECYTELEKLNILDEFEEWNIVLQVLNYLEKYKMHKEYIIIVRKLKYYIYVRGMWEIGKNSLHLKRANFAKIINNVNEELEGLCDYINICSKSKNKEEAEKYLSIADEIVKLNENDIEKRILCLYNHVRALYLYNCKKAYNECYEIWNYNKTFYSKDVSLYRNLVNDLWLTRTYININNDFEKKCIELEKRIAQMEQENFTRAVLDCKLLLIGILIKKLKNELDNKELFTKIENELDNCENIFKTKSYKDIRNEAEYFKYRAIIYSYKNENELKEEYFQKAIQNYKLMNCKEEIAHMEEEYV